MLVVANAIRSLDQLIEAEVRKLPPHKLPDRNGDLWRLLRLL
jgi:hypothetical protein